VIETHEQVARLEQRNGRIDRKLQPQPVVYCRYFVYTQRPEDRVLGVLARKTETIREKLGSFNDVLSRKLKHGIRRDQATRLAEEIDALENPAAHNATENELEVVRKRHEELRNEIAPRERQLRDSQRAIGFDSVMLRDALSCSLEIMGSPGIRDLGKGRFAFPDIEARTGAYPRWSQTLDTLRAPPKDGKRSFDWRRTAPIRPLVFEPPPGLDETVVQMHRPGPDGHDCNLCYGFVEETQHELRGSRLVAVDTKTTPIDKLDWTDPCAFSNTGRPSPTPTPSPP
jgi:hypothetical protein